MSLHRCVKTTLTFLSPSGPVSFRPCRSTSLHGMNFGSTRLHLLCVSWQVLSQCFASLNTSSEYVLRLTAVRVGAFKVSKQSKHQGPQHPMMSIPERIRMKVPRRLSEFLNLKSKRKVSFQPLMGEIPAQVKLFRSPGRASSSSPKTRPDFFNSLKMTLQKQQLFSSESTRSVRLI